MALSKNFISGLNKEKQKIIDTSGNVLVIANLGTGKTRLLSYKNKKNIREKEILN